MKTLTLLFALSLYLLPNPTYSTSNPIRLPTADVAVTSGETPVVDTDGDALRAGETYYITSTFWGAASGGVQLAWLDSTTKCASDVIKSRALTDGDPIRITPADPNATVVLPSTFQSFAFFVPTSRLCVSSVYWGIRFDRASGQYFLKSGEFVSNLSGQFKIEVVPDSFLNYKITYCPFGTDKCYNVSTYIDESVGAERFALSADFAFTVLFKKAKF
ncbi:sporamin B-like [Ipomoea triloba]|uniref:sporamin B-like n=1 Tax=Ipomoea triloba TaxID=35885 RepID=UPI00125E1038|nr:sporamin B-like [Ipomoea triloba]